MNSNDLQYVDPADLQLIAIEGAIHPRAIIKDRQCLLAAHFLRVFPLSNPTAYISIQDEKGDEYGIIENLDGLSPEGKSIIASSLDRRYFTPVIEKIDDMRQDAGMWKFKVQTQRGPAEFYVRNWRDSAHETGTGRWQIQSVDGLRFEIKKVEQLDDRSQNFLEQLL